MFHIKEKIESDQITNKLELLFSTNTFLILHINSSVY